MVAGAEECGAGAGEDVKEEKGENTITHNDDDRQHTKIKQNMVEVRGEDRDDGGNVDRNGKWGKEEEERTTIEGQRRRQGDGGC
jgi:hypothetical protein